MLDDGTTRNLYVCMYDSDVCTSGEACASPGPSARIAVLHELSHAWVLDHVDEGAVDGILALSDRTTWDNPGVTWSDRSVEYAAEVIAWGLMDEALPMVRIGAPHARNSLPRSLCSPKRRLTPTAVGGDRSPVGLGKLANAADAADPGDANAGEADPVATAAVSWLTWGDRVSMGGRRMDAKTLLNEAFRRIPELVQDACEGLGVTDLMYRPEPGANSIAWLVWHLSRVQDHHVAEIVGAEQVWADPVWAEMTGIARDVSATGFGDTPEHVASVVPLSSAALVAYNAAVTKRTLEYLVGSNDSEFDRIIDDSYDPPVSVGVRLVSVIGDNLQHAGQARYLRGSIERLR